MKRVLVVSDSHGAADKLDEILDAEKFIGRAPSQTVEFIEEEIDPILNKHLEWLGEKGDVRI